LFTPCDKRCSIKSGGPSSWPTGQTHATRVRGRVARRSPFRLTRRPARLPVGPSCFSETAPDHKWPQRTTTQQDKTRQRTVVSNPQLYNTVRVVSSVMKSDHKAVVAMSSDAATSIAKTRQQRTYRPRTPSQNDTWRRPTFPVDLTYKQTCELLRYRNMTRLLEAVYESLNSASPTVINSY